MWTRAELKGIGKRAFQANYWRCVLVALLLMILTAGYAAVSSSGSSGEALKNMMNHMTSEQAMRLASVFFGASAVVIVAAVLLQIFVFNPLTVGCYAFFTENVKTGRAEVSVIGEGFSDYGHKFLTMLLRNIYQILWGLLFIIPGIVKAYSYRMVPFIVRDNPELSANECITLSRRMMDGHKWDTFVLDLSFIGWWILSAITGGLVGLFWTNPYFYSTNAALYLKLKETMPNG